jgi:flagellar hook-associated protein 2
MATSLNLDSLVVDAKGRASFSGLGSGIDLRGTVDALIAAKRVPIDTIERRISANEAKIAAFNELGTLGQTLRSAVDRLRGAITFDNAGDAFAAKRVFASTSRADTATPSAAGALLGVSVDSRAQAGQHKVEILAVATSHKLASATVEMAAGTALGEAGTISINGASLAVTAGDSLLDLRDKINALNSGSAATGVSASIVALAADRNVLVLTADRTGTATAISLADSTGSVLENLGVLDESGAPAHQLQAAGNARIKVDGLATEISRQGNTIDDVFEGVTLSLFKAEAGTAVELAVERDLGQTKDAIVAFVDAYNALRSALNRQAQAGVKDASGATFTGALAGTSALSAIRARLAAAVGSRVEGNAGLTVLAQIGITLQGANQVTDPLQANTLKVDEAKLDQALLGQGTELRALFSFQLTSSSSDVRLAGFEASTHAKTGGYQLNVAYANGQIVSANLGGAANGSDDGSVSVAGKLLTVLQGDAKGLKLLYIGNQSASAVQLDVSVGVGAQLYFEVGALLKQTDGLIANEVAALAGQNSLRQDRADAMAARLERERERLLERFTAMEAAIASMNRLLDSIRQQVDAAFGERG